MTDRWRLLVRQGSEALLEGRFEECERLAGEAAQLPGAGPAARLLVVSVHREQGRAAEAEALARSLLSEHPGTVEGQAMLGAVLADLGRDAEAGRRLDVLDLRAASPTVAALASEIVAALASPERAAPLYPTVAAHAGTFAGCHGSMSRHLGLLCHVLGRWEEAEASFDEALRVNEAAGAPVVVAHTRRHFSALLRARGDEGDWERAIELLSAAAAIYRRLEIHRLAEEADAILRRSQDPLGMDDDAAPVDVFRRAADGWELAYGGRQAVVADRPGLDHIAGLLGAQGRPVHAVELVAGGAGLIREEVAAEYRSRLADVDVQIAVGDPVGAALARAERDYLRAELAVLSSGAPAAGHVEDRARRLVALRIRTTLDGLDTVLPALAAHLRRSIRTGTFCVYEPERPRRWRVGP